MAVSKKNDYQEKYTCNTTDLVGGYPATGVYAQNSLMYVKDTSTKQIVDIFEFIDGLWIKY